MRRPRAYLAIVILALLDLARTAGSGGEAALDPDQSYRAARSNPVVYQVDFAVTVTAPYHTKLLKVWLPLPQSDAGQEVTEGALTTFPLEIRPRVAREPVFGNRFAHFEFPNPAGAQIIRHQFQIKVWELRWELDLQGVSAPATWPKSFERYLRSDRSVAVDDVLRRQAGLIAGEGGGLGPILDWVDRNLAYDHAAASLRASSEHALSTRRGHCSDYHGLCAAFGRALNLPTRVAYGINTFPKSSPSHCKLETYLPPHGWVSFDVSETQRLIAAIAKAPGLSAEERETLAGAAKRRLHRGFRDNTWFCQTRGTDYELVPPAQGRVPVVRTIYAEADGVALPDPDPANPQQKEFAWMTSHRYTPDRPVVYPFQDWKTLRDN